MKCILVFPPQWTPLNPHFALASLYSQLKKNNCDVSIKDLNIEFYNKILTKNYLENSLINALNSLDGLNKELSKEYSPDKKAEDYSDFFKQTMEKYSKIKDFKEKRYQDAISVINSIEETINVMKSSEDFYQPELLLDALRNIDVALEIASLNYLPSSICFHDYNNAYFKLTFESIKKYCLDKSTNMFYEFFEEKVEEISNECPDFVGISINSSTQIIPGLTLAMLLKQSGNTHVHLGGNFFSRLTDVLIEKPEFFNFFADSLIVEAGEKPIIELAKYLNGEIGIEEVPNLLYLDENTVKMTEKIIPPPLDNIEPQDLEGFQLKQYLIPDIVLSVQGSRGCYWKKCTFCDHDFGQHLDYKDIDKFVDELEELSNRFNIHNFQFIDESVSSDYLRKLSTKILERGLDIKWFMNARLEKAFDKELLDLARRAGLQMILWGFESGSKKVMDLINKGIDIDKRLDILRNSNNADIWNFVYIFFGFPTETYQDAMETIKIISENSDIISSYGRSVFTLGKHTRLRDDIEKYSITKILENEEEFSPSYQYETSIGMNSQKINEVAGLCTQVCNRAYKNPLWMYLRYREILFLYISKYGAKALKNFTLS